MEAVRNYPWEHRIKRKIRKHLPEDEVEFAIINNNKLDVYIKTKSIRLTIFCGSTFTKCKEYIDKCIEERKKKYAECGICLEEHNKFSGCAVCTNRWCIDCHFKMIMENEGVSVCPYCKHSVGHEIRKHATGPAALTNHTDTMVARMKLQYLMMIRNI